MTGRPNIYSHDGSILYKMLDVFFLNGILVVNVPFSMDPMGTSPCHNHH